MDRISQSSNETTRGLRHATVALGARGRSVCRGASRSAAALVAVTALAIAAPLASNIDAATAATRGLGTSGQATVSARCYAPQTLASLRRGDVVEGTIELVAVSAKQQLYGLGAAAYVPKLGRTFTDGPKKPFRYEVAGDASLLACVDDVGMRADVRFTVYRNPVVAQRSGGTITQ